MTLTTAQHPGIGAPLPKAPQRITATAPAREELLHAVALHERVGRPTPCRTDPEPFTAENMRERERAAAMCGGCPLRELCRDYAAEAGEPWGVWGGVDRYLIVRDALMK